ncbi:hypothetical protein V2J09_000816 [Rumex salicifolius]
MSSAAITIRRTDKSLTLVLYIGRVHTLPATRYKLQLEVTDETSFVGLTVLDDDVEFMVGNTASSLFAKLGLMSMTKRGGQVRAQLINTEQQSFQTSLSIQIRVDDEDSDTSSATSPLKDALFKDEKIVFPTDEE